MADRVWPGNPFPLGVHPDGHGCNVAVFAGQAEAIELCVFVDGEEQRYELPEHKGRVFHGYVPGLGPGTRYGFRAHGRFDPSRGCWVNAAKLLVDPYARAIDGLLTPDPCLRAEDPDRPGHPDLRDSAPFVPKSIVVAPPSPVAWHRPAIREPDSILYEVHVKGATMRHALVPPELRGTYAGFAHEAMIEHLVRLGVTAVELLPVHHHVDEPTLTARGLRNYWGYNTLGYFAPHAGYAADGSAGGQVEEFRTMVRKLHAAGIEVILDVVYNHTAEGDHRGPMLSLRGLDNTVYHLDLANPARYLDFTGCGNSLDMGHPMALQLVADSLRYWVTEMGVDGFRFDLASTLAREPRSEFQLAAFFDVIQQDPVLNQVKLIAEPWDATATGYEVGNFPPLWAEWNGRYRDVVRDYWRGADHALPELATRLAGSADLYSDDGRHPFASVNFITAHDGFTLRDLVSYNRKHNLANGEDNRDGTDDNRSWNCGAEGPSHDPDVLELRDRQRRNLMSTLLLSQGVPMLLAGDELGHTQRGNNNAYCQDNDTTWLNWMAVDDRMLRFTRSLVALRRRHPVLRRRRFFTGKPALVGGLPDLVWYAPEGTQMGEQDWDLPWARSVAMFLNGTAITERGRRGERIIDTSFLVLINAWEHALCFVLPTELGQGWQVILDTRSWETTHGPKLSAGASVATVGRSLVLLRQG